jgi:hypothetical protein
LFWLQALVAVVIVCGTVIVAGGRGDGITLPGRPDPYEWADRPEPIHEEDLDELHIGVAARGYRMDEVDAVIERLGSEIGTRDERIAHLEHVIEMTDRSTDTANPYARPAAPVEDPADQPETGGPDTRA